MRHATPFIQALLGQQTPVRYASFSTACSVSGIDEQR
jgi:hypothetical protein